ncbi:phenylalanine--tRNA ligase subunit alpha [bacterium]|nr:phenylalanine--tRNA ligase subunit alpha [bacterium]
MGDKNLESGEEILARCRRALGEAGSVEEILAVKSQFLGKKGPLRDLFQSLGKLGLEEKRQKGAKIGLLKEGLEALVAQALLDAKGDLSSVRAQLLAREAYLPPIPPPHGRLHPLERVQREALSLFSSMGFDVVDGPEIETEENNFSALNIPEGHPARDDHDSFWLTDGMLLRTHTSPVQVRVMRERSPPFRIVAPGRVYRRENDDRTHASVFHQIEGLLIDKEVRFSDLKGVLASFCRSFFGVSEIRFRPDYFPFTEPSAEVAVLLDGEWIELAGAGMVHPKVLEGVGLDAQVWKGLAFGFGIDRLAMVKHGIKDLRLFLDGGARFLRPFS